MTRNIRRPPHHPQYTNLFSKLDYLLKSKALINSTILSATGAVNISYHAPINLPTEINNIWGGGGRGKESSFN